MLDTVAVHNRDGVQKGKQDQLRRLFLACRSANAEAKVNRGQLVCILKAHIVLLKHLPTKLVHFSLECWNSGLSGALQRCDLRLWTMALIHTQS